LPDAGDFDLVGIGVEGTVGTCRRTAGEAERTPSAASPSSKRTSSQVSLRASAASARPMRARTSSDLTLGIVVSITSAICS